MDLSNLIPNTSNQHTLIQEDVDPEKYQKIATTLSEKRKNLEKHLEDKELDQSMREEYAFDLMQVRQDMKMFGITEVDYQVYLTQEPTSGSDQQLPFIT